MLTPDGQAWLLELVKGATSPALIRVSENDSITAEVQCDEGFPIIEEGEVVFQGTFDGETGNFDWNSFAVVIDGRVIDQNEDDLGTKVAGSEWKLRPRVSFAALTPSGD